MKPMITPPPTDSEILSKVLEMLKDEWMLECTTLGHDNLVPKLEFLQLEDNGYDGYNTISMEFFWYDGEWYDYDDHWKLHSELRELYADKGANQS